MRRKRNRMKNKEEKEDIEENREIIDLKKKEENGKR